MPKIGILKLPEFPQVMNDCRLYKKSPLIKADMK